MPLTMLGNGETASIKQIGGTKDMKKFLRGLGFIIGENIKIVSSSGGNIIVQIKDSRVAVSKNIANKIMISCGKK